MTSLGTGSPSLALKEVYEALTYAAGAYGLSHPHTGFYSLPRIKSNNSYSINLSGHPYEKVVK
jgi:hypothetical protein